jgi:hypothetical protein
MVCGLRPRPTALRSWRPRGRQEAIEANGADRLGGSCGPVGERAPGGWLQVGAASSSGWRSMR